MVRKHDTCPSRTEGCMYVNVRLQSNASQRGLLCTYTPEPLSQKSLNPAKPSQDPQVLNPKPVTLNPRTPKNSDPGACISCGSSPPASTS